MAVVLAHAFCNWVGLPRVWGWVGDDFGIDGDGDGDEGEGRQGRSRSGNQKGVWVTVPTILYYSLLVAGAVGFYVGLNPLTRSERAIVRFGD